MLTSFLLFVSFVAAVIVIYIQLYQSTKIMQTVQQYNKYIHISHTYTNENISITISAKR